jgi:hypothetical protein
MTGVQQACHLGAGDMLATLAGSRSLSIPLLNPHLLVLQGLQTVMMILFAGIARATH